MEEEEKRAFEERLRSEKELREAYDEYRRLYDAINDKEALELRRKLKKIEAEYRRRNDRKGGIISMSFWYWLAATMILAGGITLILLYLVTDSGISRQYSEYKSIDSIYLQGERFELPGNYYLMKNMMVRNTSFEFLGPRDSSVFRRGDRIELKWTSKTRSPLELKLYDNQGRILLEKASLTGNSLKVDMALGPGVYVYQFSLKGKVGHVGVFFVVDKGSRR